MNKAHAMLQACPTLVPNVDYVVEDNGDGLGQVIRTLREGVVIPTEAVLISAEATYIIAKQKANLLQQIKELEDKIYYSELDGATDWVATKKAQRTALKQQLQAL